MVQDKTVDEILGNVIQLVRHLKMSAGELCSIYSIEREDGSESSLSVAQYRLVIYLYRHGRRSVGEVATDSGVTMATASQMLDKLVETRWVERGVNPDDRRQVLVWLSEPALTVAKQIHAFRRTQVQEALAALPELDAEAVLRVFQAFNTAIAPKSTGTDESPGDLHIFPSLQ